MNPLVKGRKIAVTGTFGAGKSVFMLSLLHHLHHLDPTQFRLGEKRGRPITVKGLKSLPVPQAHQQFPYSDEARRLIQPGGGSWPNRAHSIHRYELQFRRARHLVRDRLNFMSFPLERMMDLCIARTPSYTEWADQTLFLIDQDPKASRQARQFMSYLDAPELNSDQLINIYKQTLTQFVFDYQTFAAPSTFTIDLEGNRIEGGIPKVVSQSRYAGLPPREGRGPVEFIPLSGVTRMRAPQLVTQQERNYQIYREEIIVPLFKEVTQSDTLVVLIDIPSLLSGGRSAYDEQRWLLNELMGLVRLKGRSRTSFGRSRINKVALIATKVDLVRTFERDARLPGLLRQLTDPFTQELHPNVEVGRFICSPCMSTRTTQNPDTLIGRMVHASKNSERIERVFTVPEAPRFWPEDYKPTDFPFLKVWPPVLQAHEKIPRHLRLDDVCRFLLG